MNFKKNTITYVSLDSIREGVGASQVLSYVEKLSKEFTMNLISFEKIEPTLEQIERLEKQGIKWSPIAFGRYGTLGGMQRFLKLIQILPRKQVIHARSDLAAFASLIVNRRGVIWDCRAFLADQRRAILGWSTFSIKFIIMRLIERYVAKNSSRIITITENVIPVLVKRYRLKREKMVHITTCVDQSRFKPTQILGKQVVALISGTVSDAYDIDLMNLIITELRRRCDLRVVVSLGQGHGEAWTRISFDEVIRKSYYEMPNVIASSSFGFSIWKKNLGVALSSVASTKCAEFLACGRPIIVNQNQGDIGRIVVQENVGVATYGDTQVEVDSYAKQILELISDSSIESRCSLVAKSYFDLDKAVKDLTKLYQELERQNV